MSESSTKPHVVFAVPGSLETPTGGYVYDRRVIAELRRQGWHVDIVSLSERFPDPDMSALVSAYTAIAMMAPGTPLVVDGLALGAMPDIGQHLKPSTPLVALVHHPLAMETGLLPDRAAALRASEYRALKAARHVVTTSATTASVLSFDYGVPDDAITVVSPGTDPAPLANGSADDRVALLSVGAVTRRKGHDLLLAALAMIKHLPWHIDIVGDLTRDPAAVAHLRNSIPYLGLEERVRLRGAVSGEDLEAAYDAADIFVLASYYEGYGMVFAEAIARGLPVIGTTGGAIPEAVPKGSGLLVPPGDLVALVGALRDMIDSHEIRERYRAGARQAAQSLPRWEQAGAQFARVLGAVVAG